MEVTSKIKSIFSDELLRYTAAICDTRRIESNADKMIMLGNLLYTYKIDFEILGGATNRIALQVDGYAVKFAMDEQGYLDNMIEYSLSPELQPYVTKSFETNGYILIAECVEAITSEEKFRANRYAILKVLDELAQDYLLGDVGYLVKNMTNWGLRNGQPVILDYAYCHRATEGLFTCSRCGRTLTYDSNYDKFLCSDRSACKAVYTYNERKRIQGTAVDEKMVAERKADSIVMRQGVKTKDIELFEDRLLGDNYFIIDNPGDLHRYEKLKEEIIMNLTINGEEEDNVMMDRLSAIVRLAQNPNDEDAKKVVFQNLSDDVQVPEPVYTEHYQNTYAYGYVPPMRVLPVVPRDVYPGDELPEDDNGDDVYCDQESALSSIISQVKASVESEERAQAEAIRSAEDAYFTDLERRRASEGVAEEPPLVDGTDDDQLAESAEDKGEVEQQTGQSTEVDSHDDAPAVTPTPEVGTQTSVDATSETDGEEPVQELTGITINGVPLKIGEEVILGGRD